MRRSTPGVRCRIVTDNQTPGLAFDNSYARLPDRFFARVAPTPVRDPRLICINRELGAELNIAAEWLASPDSVQVLAGNRVAPGSEPIAQAYSGHQFGHFSGTLGDGRAVLLGEVVDQNGRRRDIQLKGSGPTPFSRRGDGRAALGPVLREYVVSEAMAALGVPTTRALAAVTTGETVARETMLPGAVLTRVASSHIRVGTFQFFAAAGDAEGVRLLADHVLARLYPEAATAERPYRALLDAVIGAQAELVARWLLVGFIHGVMNTDNASIAGETIDYGPCAFMDAYDPATVFSSIDHMGRYAYGNQPAIAHWNLARFAETILPLLDADENAAIEQAQDALAAFGERFQAAYHGGLRRKIGLVTAQDGDVELAGDLLKLMAAQAVDLTLLFRRLGDIDLPGGTDAVRALFSQTPAFEVWASRWRERLGRENTDAAARRAMMHAANPAFVPRNHRVAAVIAAAVERDDFEPFAELLTVLSKPYEDQPEFHRYAEPPQMHERVLATFCGT
ncbi:MAG: UPF0061 protein YdiU [uncultured Sphingomonadaceae bacterium]|uniref:Protein nucleotidyltransferase YdiU n=1 Tax=uncultured Sphingomonadaceae bacterium TaxID=169976 RepID=A0A6J4TXQ4_9SPHN|nr:MAG: UPF0061 protein YdiU [uncultured Sphingomonadaceae bacterium]